MKGSVTIRELIEACFVWYEAYGVSHPGTDIALKMYVTINKNIFNLLRSRRKVDITKINTWLKAILSNGPIDAWADLIGLFVFWSMKKAAIEEIYLDVTDRNPLFND